MEMNGVALPRWDYRVPGVTSISADLQMRLCVEVSQAIAYRDMAILKHQMFVHVDWPGGMFASPAIFQRPCCR